MCALLFLLMHMMDVMVGVSGDGDIHHHYDRFQSRRGKERKTVKSSRIG